MDQFITLLIYFISALLQLLYWTIFIHVIMSWVATGKTPIGEIIESIVNPVLKPFRWARIGMFDLSPILALFTLSFLSQIITRELTKFL